MEFQELRTAQFFQRAIKLDMQISGNDDPQISADYLLGYWQGSLNDYTSHPARIVNIILNLQLPKPTRKEKPIAPKEFNFEMLPEEDNPPN